jgi:hypothetical protein
MNVLAPGSLLKNGMSTDNLGLFSICIDRGVAIFFIELRVINQKSLFSQPLKRGFGK